MTDDKIHPKFAKLSPTGRSSLQNREPNMQRLPLRTEEGRKIADALRPSISEELMNADYNTLELRVLAQMKEKGITVDEEWIKTVEDENTKRFITLEFGPEEFARRFFLHYGIPIDDD